MKDEEMKNRISLALKDPILQQGFEIICKENAELKEEIEDWKACHEHQLDLMKGLNDRIADLEKQIPQWHKVADGDLPQPTGEYEHQSFPQIPCLCEIKKLYGVRYWNVKYQCWDDEDCDDAFCDKDGVDRWCYLDELT